MPVKLFFSVNPINVFSWLLVGALVWAVIYMLSSVPFNDIQLLLPYLAASTALLVFVFWSLFWKLNSRVYFIISVYSVILSGYVFESYLYFTGYDTNPRVTLARKHGTNFDSRTYYEFLRDQRKAGDFVYPEVSAIECRQVLLKLNPALDIFPLSSPSSSSVLLGNESGEYVIMSTGPFGFRNPKDILSKKPTDITMIGNSFTAGKDVPDGLDMAGVLRTQGYSVINLGKGGNGPLLNLAVLSEYGPVFRTKFVLWFYFEGNDLQELHYENNDAFLLKYLNKGFTQGLSQTQSRSDNAIKLCNSTLFKKAQIRATRKENTPWLFQFAKLTYTRNIVKFYFDSRKKPYFIPELGLLKEVLTIAKEETASWGGKFVFIYLPYYKRFLADVGSGEHDSLRKSDVLSLVRSLNVPVFDLSPVFTSQPNIFKLFPPGGGHYNELGYQFVANQLATFIEHLPPGNNE